VLRIEKLARSHDVTSFDCGVEPLNMFLQRYARQNQKADAAQTYVGLMDDQIIGFYTLVAAQIEFDHAPDRLRKGLARHPVPIILLARLAVQTGLQGRGIGHGLLRDATLRAIQAAEIAGVRAIVVEAKDEKARSFYQRFGFADGFANPNILYVLTKDLRVVSN
jgi:GNAT superfamily N-acetyltransferase